MTGPADRIVNLYRTHARQWDRERVKSLEEEWRWLDRFTSLLPLGGTVLDIGCGSGNPIARHLWQSGFAVTGVDAAVELVAMARASLPEGQWIVSDMRQIALDRRFDGLLAWHSSFHLTPDDQRRLFARFAAHASPGAALMFTTGPEKGEVIGCFAGEPLYHASLDPTEYRELLTKNGFEVVDIRFNDPFSGGASVWLARYVRRTSSEGV